MLPLFEIQINLFSIDFLKKKYIIQTVNFIYQKIRSSFASLKRIITEFLINILKKKCTQSSYWNTYYNALKKKKKISFYHYNKYLIINLKNCLRKISYLNFSNLILLVINKYFFFIKTLFGSVSIEPILANKFKRSSVQKLFIKIIVYNLIINNFNKTIIKNNKLKFYRIKKNKNLSYKHFTFFTRHFNFIFICGQFNFSFVNKLQFKFFFFFKQKGIIVKNISIFVGKVFNLKNNFVFFNFNFFCLFNKLNEFKCTIFFNIFNSTLKKKCKFNWKKKIIFLFIEFKILKSFKNLFFKFFFFKSFVMPIWNIMFKVNQVYRKFLLYFCVSNIIKWQLKNLDIFINRLFFKILKNKFASKPKLIQYIVYNFKKTNIFVYEDLFLLKLPNIAIVRNIFFST